MRISGSKIANLKPDIKISQTYHVAAWTDGILIKEAEINALLGIEGKKLVAAVPVGYPDEIPRVPPRREGRIQWVEF